MAPVEPKYLLLTAKILWSWLLPRLTKREAIPQVVLVEHEDWDHEFVDLTNQVELSNIGFSIRIRGPEKRVFYPKRFGIAIRRFGLWGEIHLDRDFQPEECGEVQIGEEREYRLQLSAHEFAMEIRKITEKPFVRIRPTVQDLMGKTHTGTPLGFDVGEAVGGRLLEADEVAYYRNSR